MRKVSRISPFISEMALIFTGKYPRINFLYFIQKFIDEYGDFFYFEEDDFLKKARELELTSYEEDTTMSPEETLYTIGEHWAKHFPDFRFGQLVHNACCTEALTTLSVKNKDLAEYFQSLIF